MLHTKFFNGLLPHLRHGILHTFDKVKDFDQLLVATRKIELEESKLKTDPESTTTKSRKGQVKMAKATEDDSTAGNLSH